MAGRRVDVFLCECGPILQEAVDLDDIGRRVEALDGVNRVLRYSTLCSEKGRAWMAEQIAGSDAERQVVAACSPREHEVTFRGACSDAGRNPFMLAVANIREQAAWVSPSRAEATDKAFASVRGALARVQHQIPLERREIEANCDVVVVGAGIAGLTAAMTLASAGRKVHLVERDPVIGGRTARLSDLFPTLECASCVIEPLLDDVLHHDNIEVHLLSEVEEIVGYFGNFTVAIREHARHVDPDVCLGMRCCHEVCPVEVPNMWEAGLSTRKAIYMPYRGGLPNVSAVDERACLHFVDDSCDACVSACPFHAINLGGQDIVRRVAAGAIVVATGAELHTRDEPDSAYLLPQVFTTMALERMFNSSGCTDGRVVLRDGTTPQSVALIHCADETGAGPALPCSKICCMSLAKHARLLRDKLPDAEIIMVEWERVVGGKGFREFAHAAAKHSGAEEIRLGPGDQVSVTAAGNRARLTMTRGNERSEREVDMVVMAPPLHSADNAARLAAQLRLESGPQGFLVEAQARIRSFASRVEGVMVAGSVQGPKDIDESATHGAAAAGATLAALVPGRKLTIEAARAVVDALECGGCRSCPQVCPFKAITFDDERRVAEVNDLLCRGCGTCVAACPSAAITARGFSDEAIYAEIEALVS